MDTVQRRWCVKRSRSLPHGDESNRYRAGVLNLGCVRTSIPRKTSYGSRTHAIKVRFETGAKANMTFRPEFMRRGNDRYRGNRSWLRNRRPKLLLHFLQPNFRLQRVLELSRHLHGRVGKWGGATSTSTQARTSHIHRGPSDCHFAFAIVWPGSQAAVFWLTIQIARSARGSRGMQPARSAWRCFPP